MSPGRAPLGGSRSAAGGRAPATPRAALASLGNGAPLHGERKGAKPALRTGAPVIARGAASSVRELPHQPHAPPSRVESARKTRSTTLEPLTLTLTAGGIVIGVQVGLFAWLRHDIGGLSNRLDRVERDVAFVRGQLSLALPALAHSNVNVPTIPPNVGG